MINKESIEKVLKEIELSDLDVSLYTDTFMSVWELVKHTYTNDKGHDDNHIYHVFKRSMNMVKWLRYNSRNFSDNKESMYILKLGVASLVHDVFSYTYRRTHHIEAHRLIRMLIDLKVIEGNHIDPLTKAEMVYQQKVDIVTFLNRHITTGVDDNNISGKFKWLDKFTKYDLVEVSEMVLQHRASYDGEFNTELCEVFSIADRDTLDLGIIVNRIYGCAEDEMYIFDIEGNEPLNIIINNVSYHSKEIIPYLKESLGWDNRKIKTFYHLWEKFSRIGYMFNNLNPDGIYFKYYKDVIESYYKEVDNIIVDPEKMLVYLKLKG